MEYNTDEHYKICVPNPLYHCFGCVLGLLSSIAFKQTCVFPSPWFDPKAVVAAIEEDKCQVVYGTPTMFVDILSNESFWKIDYSCLKKGTYEAHLKYFQV